MFTVKMFRTMSSRTSQRKRDREDRLLLPAEHCWLFWFSTDDTTVILYEKDRNWPQHLTSIEKISLKKGTEVEFPSIGSRGKFLCQGLFDNVVQVCAYVNKLPREEGLSDANITNLLEDAVSGIDINSSRYGAQDPFGFDEVGNEENSPPRSPELLYAEESEQENVQPSKKKKKQQATCQQCSQRSTEETRAKDLAWERFCHVLSRFEQRLDRVEEVESEMIKFMKKAEKELDAANSARLSVAGEAELVTGELMHNNINLLTLGGDTDNEKTKRIAEALWTPEELGKYCIDPRRSNLGTGKSGNRVPADEERSAKYKEAVRVVLGDRYSDKLYRQTLALVNQKGRDSNKKMP